MAVTWGTPTPATTRVVQIEPGPMPTLTPSAPASISARVAPAVATLPAITWTWFEYFLIASTGRPGPVIGFRVDMDALDLNESTAADHLPQREGFTSCNAGIMHACGHDAHAAMLAGAARALCARKDQIPGTIVFMFFNDWQLAMVVLLGVPMVAPSTSGVSGFWLLRSVVPEVLL